MENPSMVQDGRAMTTLKEWAIAERDSWRDKNADRYWQMNRVVNELERRLATCPTCGITQPADAPHGPCVKFP
jgi:hypothetical protein